MPRLSPSVRRAPVEMLESRRLLSGGDPLTLGDDKLDWLLGRLRARLAGVTLMRKPPHPGRLHALLGRLRFPAAG